jgi:hypothetical protein
VIRRFAIGLLVVSVALAGLAFAQDVGEEPPLRLKKKGAAAEGPAKVEPEKPEPGKPPVGPVKPEPPKEGPEPPEGGEPEIDEQEVLNRIGKNMRTSEDRLANRELTDGTRQVQEDILKDIDLLLDQSQNDQQNQNQNQQASSNPSGGGSQSKSRLRGGSRQQRQQAGRRGSRGQQQAGRGQGQGAQGEQQANRGQGQKPGEAQGQGGNMGGGGGRSEGEINKLMDLYKDVWGHLPETQRAEMTAYSREKFMDKYNELIKQYYSSIAEKSRKKE